jgi:hypothetical protein
VLQIHYLLGNLETEFKLDKGKELEIKSDYGVTYEPVRIKNNYPRVNGDELARLQKEIKDEDSFFLRSCVIASTQDQAFANIAFLQTFIQEQKDRGILASQSARERALLVAILSLKEPQENGDGRDVANGMAVLKDLVKTLEPAALRAMFAKSFFRKPIQMSLGSKTVAEVLELLEALRAQDD